MPPLSRNRLRRLLAAVDIAQTNQEKGDSWEELCDYILSCIPGFEIRLRNTQHVLDRFELDIAVWNDQRANGLRTLPDVIFVEAKNWASPVGAAEVAAFFVKLQQQGVRFGILIAANGVTGDATDRTAARGTISVALHDERRIIVMDRSEIAALTSTASLIALIKLKICQLVAGADMLPGA
jgi:hypothetical protein